MFQAALLLYEEHGEKVSVMRFNGTSWEHVGAAPSSQTTQPGGTSPALKESGTDYLLYKDYGNGDNPSAMKFAPATYPFYLFRTAFA